LRPSRRREAQRKQPRFSIETTKPKKEKQSWYLGFARWSGGIVRGKPDFKNQKLKSSIGFLGWDLSPQEVNAAPVVAILFGFLLALPLVGYLLYSTFILGTFSYLILLYVFPVVIIFPFLLSIWIQNYPIAAAHSEQRKAITEIPEIVNYLVMSMKLSPNLERAVQFAAQHGKGRISKDLQTLLYQTQTGMYKSMEEGFDELAYKWGDFSDEFKHALMLIRSSVIEVDEAKRHVILDKAVSDVLEGVSDQMSKYATEMRQPSIYLYYVGVLLPLLLIIMLPIGSVMARLPLAETWILVLLYNFLIPIGTMVFARSILEKRPPVYSPPKIPKSFPGAMATGSPIVLGIIAGVAIFLLFSAVVDPVLNPFPPAFDADARANWYPFFTIAGGVFAPVAFISIYLYGSTYKRRKIQKNIMAMEMEFQDAIYVIASRLGENRPIEEALTYTAKFMDKTKIATVFQKAADNINNMGLTAEGALFDPTYGALNDIPSDTIRGSLRIVIDSVNLGVQQAARALISLSLQLRDSLKVREKINTMLEEITAMMKSIAFLIAPLVLGITSALQKIIISALQAVGGQQQTSAIGPNIPITSIGDTSQLANIPDASTFLAIIALYVIEVTIVLIYFTSKIEEGDNDLAFRMNLAKSLPIAVLLFFASAWVAGQFTGIA
jgi:hypothetical protein